MISCHEGLILPVARLKNCQVEFVHFSISSKSRRTTVRYVWFKLYSGVDKFQEVIRGSCHPNKQSFSPLREGPQKLLTGPITYFSVCRDFFKFKLGIHCDIVQVGLFVNIYCLWMNMHLIADIAQLYFSAREVISMRKFLGSSETLSQRICRMSML